jgi:hypothetical protein
VFGSEPNPSTHYSQAYIFTESEPQLQAYTLSKCQSFVFAYLIESIGFAFIISKYQPICKANVPAYKLEPDDSPAYFKQAYEFSYPRMCLWIVASFR